MRTIQTRRRFVAGLSGIGVATLLRTPGLAAGVPLETDSVRLPKLPSICVAPQYVVGDLLRAEGFTDIRYVALPPGTNTPDAIAQGAVDFGLNYAPVQIAGIDRGVAMKVLAGVHVGCFELFVANPIRSVPDLAGRKVGIPAAGTPEHMFLSVIAANVGLDPAQIDWVTRALRSARCSCSSTARSMRFSAFHQSRKNCAPRGSAASSSTARSIARGRNISAACWRAAPTTSKIIRTRPSGWCAQF